MLEAKEPLASYCCQWSFGFDVHMKDSRLMGRDVKSAPLDATTVGSSARHCPDAKLWLAPRTCTGEARDVAQVALKTGFAA
jgi:hypothetical protein